MENINTITCLDNKDSCTLNNTCYLIYHGNDKQTTENAKQYASIFKELFDDYELVNDQRQKNFLYKSLFLNDGKTSQCILAHHDQYKKYISLQYNNENYFPNGKLISLEETEFECLSIFFDYKQNKNTEINNLFDIMETSLYSYSEKNKDDDEKYIVWKTLDGKILDFKFNNIAFSFHNALNIRLNITIHIVPILEEKQFSIEQNTHQYGRIEQNIVCLYQMKDIFV